MVERHLKVEHFRFENNVEDWTTESMLMKEEDERNQNEVALIMSTKFGGKITLGNKILAQAIQRNRAKKRGHGDSWSSTTLMQ